ncbi:MAG TPA: caspase family protein, partial [Labilithrix sp.]
MTRLHSLPLAFLLALAPASARADDTPVQAQATVPHPFAYGILVGSNAGGPGQITLHYAEDDARKVAQVLRELGRYGQTDLRVLTAPDGAKVLAAIDDVAQKMKAHAAKGEQAVLVFYYSGHAKANAFDLGAEELPITTLREKLRAIPSTLTLVVLDACQSGQFARIKGVEPAADFSFNSVSRLTQKGIAVMASSSAQELSQESDELKGSFFTHHFVTALRGAADADGDGRVSLDEAYRYAYRRTLTSTSTTKVGSQHVTLETDLAGQGEVPVTYPADMRSQLELPGPLDGKVLVQHKASGNVVAEVQKAPGAPLRLAFTAGAYEAIVRASGKIHRCKLALSDDRVTPIDLGQCDEVKASSLAKGDFGWESEDGEPEPDRAPTEPRVPTEPWAAEVG